jgi:hypothetical protein
MPTQEDLARFSAENGRATVSTEDRDLNQSVDITVNDDSYEQFKTKIQTEQPPEKEIKIKANDTEF